MASRAHAEAAERIEMMRAGGWNMRVAVRPAAAPGQPPLLLCNGIGASLEILQPFVEALTPRRDIVRVDLPGIGGSPQSGRPYRLTTMACALSDLISRLGYRQADVLGISWGGGLAQQLAFGRPDQVRRLVLVSTGTGSLMVPASPRVLRHMVTPQRHRDPEYAVRVAAEIYGGSLRRDPELARALLYARRAGGSRRGYYLQLLAAAGWTSLPLLPLIGQPTLLLAGDDDPVIPLVNARLMHRMIRGSSLRVYQGGHLELIARPAQLAPVVEEFLDDPAAAGRRPAGGQAAAEKGRS